MVLIRRGYKSISWWLPDEVISEIIQAAPRYDQAALCRASKLFHALGVRILYRVVDLDDYPSIAGFCLTVLTNTAKFSHLVRSLTVDRISSNIERVINTKKIKILN